MIKKKISLPKIHLYKIIQRNRTIIKQTFVYLLFLGLMFLFLSDIFPEINTKLIGIPGDNYYYIWIGKWFSQNRLHDYLITQVYYPLGVDISAGWDGSIIYFLGAIINKIFDPIVSYNIIVISCFIVNFLLCKYILSKYTKNILFSGVSSIFFVFSSFFFARSMGHPTYLMFFPIPILIYLITEKNWKDFSYKNALLFVLLMGLSSVISWYFIIFLYLIISIFFVKNYLNSNQKKILLVKFIMINLSVFFLILILNFPMFRAFIFGSDFFYPYPFKMDNHELNRELSMKLINYFDIYTNFRWYKIPLLSGGSIEKMLYPGTFFMVLIIMFFIHSISTKNIKFWKKEKWILMTIVLFFILSLGVNSIFPLYKILVKLPLISFIHSPARFGLIVIWLLVVIINKYIKQIKFNILLILIMLTLGIINLYEISNRKFQFYNINDYRILTNISNTDDSNFILDLPIRSDQDVLLIPIFSSKSTLMGYTPHTTYSPDLTCFLDNNALNIFRKEKIVQEDILPDVDVDLALLYLHYKFDTNIIVVNKNHLTDNNRNFYNDFNKKQYLTILNENSKVIIYKINEKLLQEVNTGKPLIPIGGRGVGYTTKNGEGQILRGFNHDFEFDIINTDNYPKHIKLELKYSSPFDSHIIFQNEKVKDFIEIELQPGINNLLFSNNKECQPGYSYFQCINGFINEIQLIVLN